MENYEQLILVAIEGDTPRQKYENLKDMMANLTLAKRFIAGLKDTPDSADIKSLRSFINAHHKTINETLNK